MINLAIIPKTPRLSLQEAGSVAAAIQQHIQQSFAPIWQVSATVTVLSEPYSGCTPIYVYDDIGEPGLTGYHTTHGGAPEYPSAYALVQYGPTWSLAASHECLEILVDPTADRRWSAVLPAANRTVDFILEVCDPCQNFAYSHAIGPYPLSDFCTPDYYANTTDPGVVYCLSRKIVEPKEILPGGTLSWIDGDGHGYQAVNVGGTVTTSDHGPYNPGPLPAREYMNGFDQGFTSLSHASGDKAAQRRVIANAKAMAKRNVEYRRRFDRELKRQFAAAGKLPPG